jgi:hypothetical protein
MPINLKCHLNSLIQAAEILDHKFSEERGIVLKIALPLSSSPISSLDLSVSPLGPDVLIGLPENPGRGRIIYCCVTNYIPIM